MSATVRVAEGMNELPGDTIDGAVDLVVVDADIEADGDVEVWTVVDEVDFVGVIDVVLAESIVVEGPNPELATEAVVVIKGVNKELLDDIADLAEDCDVVHTVVSHFVIGQVVKVRVTVTVVDVSVVSESGVAARARKQTARKITKDFILTNKKRVDEGNNLHMQDRT